MSILPISVSDLEAYARIFNWDEDLDFFCACVFGLDDEFLSINAKKKESDAEQQKQRNKRKGK